jgi:hypothetical protein
MRKLFGFVLALVVIIFVPTLLAQQSMNNDSIVKFVKSGITDDTILTIVKTVPGNYDTTPQALLSLKASGVSDKVIATIVGLPAASQPAVLPSPAANATPPMPQVAPTQPRIFFLSKSSGNNRNASRDQSMEMSKDFEKTCPGTRITLNQTAADYTVALNHIEVGLIVRDNQFQIANHDGDLIATTKEGGSIANGVNRACQVIMDDWSKH